MSHAKQVRISRYKEFDNEHVLFNYRKMDVDVAEELAREASLKDPNDIYYVHFDDLMNPSSDLRWVNGTSYHYSEVCLEDGRPVIKTQQQEDTSSVSLTEDDLKDLSDTSNLTL